LIDAWLAALAGLLIGSFLNVCIYRWPRDLSVVRPRSYCPQCEKPIAWFDNIPLISFLLLRGRCRHCRARIPIRYLIVELLTAISFFVSFWFLGASAPAVKYCVFAAVMITLIFSDLEERILPDEFTLGGAAAGVILAAFVPLRWGIMSLLVHSVHNMRVVSCAEAVFAGCVCAGALWLIRFVYEKVRHREGLGFGDVKMVGMIGTFLGLEGALLALFVGSVLGSIMGLFYIWFAGKDATYEFPFGSFLGVAALAVAFILGVILHGSNATM